jgi:hypothetical protein
MDGDVVERVRRAIYGPFASQGHAPSRQLIQDLAAVDEAQASEAIAELAVQRYLALDRSGNVVMAQSACQDCGPGVSPSSTSTSLSPK